METQYRRHRTRDQDGLYIGTTDIPSTTDAVGIECPTKNCWYVFDSDLGLGLTVLFQSFFSIQELVKKLNLRKL